MPPYESPTVVNSNKNSTNAKLINSLNECGMIYPKLKGLKI